jgi:hypothetical protein
MSVNCMWVCGRRRLWSTLRSVRKAENVLRTLRWNAQFRLVARAPTCTAPVHMHMFCNLPLCLPVCWRMSSDCDSYRMSIVIALFVYLPREFLRARLTQDDRAMGWIDSSVFFRLPSYVRLLMWLRQQRLGKDDILCSSVRLKNYCYNWILL